MKCPKCGYNSFDHLESCKKCGSDLAQFKSDHGLSGPLFAGRPARKTTEAPPENRAEDDGADADALTDTVAGNRGGTATNPENDLPEWADEEPVDPPFLPSGYFPEQGPNLWSRLASNLVDLFVLTVIFALFILAGNAIILPGETRRFLPPLEEILILSTPYFLVLFFVCFGYFTFFHYLTGQTPGKMAFGLRVESHQGGALSFSQVFLRSVGGLISLLTAGAGYLLILLNREGRGWNDRLAGSRVVRRSGWQKEDENQANFAEGPG